MQGPNVAKLVKLPYGSSGMDTAQGAGVLLHSVCTGWLGKGLAHSNKNQNLSVSTKTSVNPISNQVLLSGLIHDKITLPVVMPHE